MEKTFENNTAGSITNNFPAPKKADLQTVDTIENFARIFGRETTNRNGAWVIDGAVPFMRFKGPTRCALLPSLGLKYLPIKLDDCDAVCHLQIGRSVSDQSRAPSCWRSYRFY